MTDCPHCQRPIEISEINHGTLFTCPLCNSVYFVGWDGQPELPPTAEDMAAENPSQSSDSSEATPEYDNDATKMSFAPMESSGQETIIDNTTYQPQDYESLDQAHSENLNEEELLASEPEPQLEPEAEGSYDFSKPLDRIEEASSTIDSPGFQDVSDFANSDQVTGGLTYSLTIRGIDSKKIYGDLRDALADSRFGWDANILMKGVRNGSLTINGLNPAKTFVVVSRIKYLSLQISWRQDVLATI